jgi:type IV secretory pathway VirB4 component
MMKKADKNTVQQKADKAKLKERAKIAKTVQQTIPYLAAYPCGALQVAPTRFSRAYALSDINFTTASQDEQEELFDAFCLLLNTLSEADVQICCMNKAVDIEAFKKKHLIAFKNDGLDVYRNEVNDIMLQNLGGGKSITNEKYIVLTINAENIDIAMTQFNRLDATVIDAARDVGGSEARPLTMEEWLGVLYHVYNPHSSEEFHVDFNALKSQGLTTKDAIAPDSMQVKSNKMMLGDVYAASLVLTKFPSSLTTDFIADLNELPCHLVTSIHLTSIQQDKSIKMVRNQLTNINASILEQQKKAAQKGYSSGLISPDLESARNEAMDLLADITGKNQRLYYGTIVTTVYAEDEEQLKELIKLVQSVGQKYMCRLNKLDYQQDNGLNTAAPMGLCDISVNSLLTTEAAALFIPFASEELTHEGGLYYGLNAVTHNMILFNRLKSRNSNGVILGTPGSGKSFSAKREILAVLLGTDADVYVVDPECEYAPLAELLGGEVIRIAAGSNVHINPLDMDIKFADDDDPVTLKADFMCAICETAIGGRYGLSPIQKSIIDRCVREVYKPYMEYLHKHPGVTCAPEITPTLIDFYERLLAQPEPEAQSVALSLELYCTGSLDVFAHRTNVNTNSRFIIYDIKNIGSGLKELGLQVCLNDIWNKTIANKNLSKRTWFYLDEFYLLTQTESSARFLQQIWKRARKWGGVPTGITQNVEDLLASNEARSILNNCDFVMMLNQSPIDRAQLSQLFHISTSLQQHITNSRPGHGLIYTGRTIIPFADVYPKDTQSFRVMTTNPNDVAAFKASQETKHGK